MPTLNLNLDDSIVVNSENKVQIKSSPSSNNTLQIKDNGLYAESIPGTPGSSGTGYPDGYRSNNGIMSGITSPENGDAYPLRLVAPSIVHRIFTCEQEDGTDIPLRNFDIVYPGDMYRVKDVEHNSYKYYLITKTDGTRITQAAPVLVATVPCVDNDPIN